MPSREELRLSRSVITGASGTTFAAVAIVACVIGAVAGSTPRMGMVALATLAAAGLICRFGIDRVLIWSLAVPWQYLPGVNGNPLLNPLTALAVLRLLWSIISLSSRRADSTVGRMKPSAIAFLLTIPLAYAVDYILLGAVESSLTYWLIPLTILTASLALRNISEKLVRRHLFLLGVVTAGAVLIEMITGFSFAALLSANDTVNSYLTGGSRAIGPTGNPLFTSMILLAGFFSSMGRGRAFPFQLLMVIALLATGSKSGVVGLVVGLCLWLLSRNRTSAIRTIAGCILVLAVLPSLFPAAAAQAISRFSVFDQLGTYDEDRAYTQALVIEKIEDSPLTPRPIGSTLQEKRATSPLETGAEFGIESSWLSAAADLGVLPLLICAICFTLAICKDDDRWRTCVGAALIASLYFWNGLYGAWLAAPLLCLVVSCQRTQLVPHLSPTTDQPRTP